MKMTLREAIRDALAVEMRKDPRVFLLGEDIGAYGGTLQITLGLWDEFGGERVIDTPLSEVAITGAAIGAAMMGMRPVLEIMFADFIPLALDQILNNAAKMCYSTMAKCPCLWSYAPLSAGGCAPVCTTVKASKRCSLISQE
jgi:pyruvate dehydrogenase E1 component beta subunit